MIEERVRNTIHALLAGIAAAWTAGDANRLARAFSEDAIFVAFDGSRLSGQAEICQFHLHPFATVLRGARLLIDLIEIRALSRSIYLVATSGGPTIPGRPAVQETQTFVCREIEDRWEIVFFQNTPVLRARGR